MTATTTTAALVPIQPAFTDAERLALAGCCALPAVKCGHAGVERDVSDSPE